MRHPTIARMMSRAENEARVLEDRWDALEETNPERPTIEKRLHELELEIRSLELAETDPEAHGFPWDSPSLPDRYPY
jgi:hypothetical protein